MSKTIAAGLIAAVLAMGTAAQASVQISTAATSNMSCSAGVCSPTAKVAVLNVDDLTGMLASGDVTVTTGSGAVTIGILSPFSWTSSSRLTLDAYYTVSFQAPVTVAGQGAVTIVTNDGGKGGDLFFSPVGKLDFWDTGSNLVVNGKSHVLVNDLVSLASAIRNDQLANVALANDYDAAQDGKYMYGAVTTDFAGTFEGLGHSISNFRAEGIPHVISNVGLFRSINRAVLRDLHMVNATVKASDQNAVGALVGSAPFGTITGVSVTGTIVGGGNSVAGGVAGANAYGTITRSSSAATVRTRAASFAGGLVGVGATIRDSHATGNVTSGSSSNSGGLAGYISGKGPKGQAIIAQSWASGDVVCPNNGRVQIGGLIGGGGQYTRLQDTYAEGNVTATGGMSWIGGLVGWEPQVVPIQTSYSIGHVQVGSVPSGGPRAGGFIGSDYTGEGFKLDYWDTDTSGYARGCGTFKCPGVKGFTDAQLKAGLPAGFDPSIWAQSPNINNGYPYLLANPPPQ